MKTCKECGELNDENNFYAGQGECKLCTRSRVKKRELLLREDPQWLSAEKERHRKKYYRLNYREKHKPTQEQKRLAMERYKKKYPEKISAHLYLLGKKIKTIVDGNELHHWSYHKEHWSDVIELSTLQHAKLHRYMVYDQERMMYRIASTGELLDTKELHLYFYESIKDRP